MWFLWDDWEGDSPSGLLPSFFAPTIRQTNRKEVFMMAQSISGSNPRMVVDQTYAGWSEYDVKEKAWEVMTFKYERYIKLDFRGTFLQVATGKQVTLSEIFPSIRNCVDAEGVIIAKRKTYGEELKAFKKRKARVPRK